MVFNLFFSILLILTVICLYLFLPELLLHVLGIGSWKRQYSSGVSLTFDDGPDPLYTPNLLSILERQNVKACFFLVGEKAEKYPEIVKMIQNQGHLIGYHGYLHKHAWLMTPRKTWKLWDKGIEIIENITGIKPDYIRPPWGSTNMALYLWCLLKNKRMIIWNTHGFDWLQKRTPQKIINRIIKHTKEGTIVLLHDSGGEPGAPQNTLACIDELCTIIREHLKLPIVPLNFPTWSLLRRLVFRVWEKWEHIYAKVFKINRIDANNLFRLGLSRYHGPDLIQADGKVLATKGDIVGEIHFDSIRLQSIGPDLHKTGIRALKLARLSLPILAKYISVNPDHKDIKVYLGITMLNRGVKRLGFNVQEYSERNGRIIGLFQKIIVHIYHPSGGKRKTESLGDKPKLVWISKQTLIEKYSNKEKIIS